ncbi:MAG TPA: response regulator [Pyrinomonadaceae bacterium]|nr:response regulator [Pyrinomonadaceae bacterium]
MTESLKQNDRVYVSLDVVWHGTAGKFDARMGELSMDGCFIDSMGQEILGETVNFKVHLPEGPWITLQGEVIYQEYPVGFEVRFTNLTDDNRRLLIQVIAAHGGKQAQQLLREASEVKRQTPVSEKSNRVLIAEDEAMTMRMLTVIIESQGYSVVSAPDGREAFRILQEDANFDAAIFDMMMPHLHGMDLIHYMKTDERLSHIPIGMITAEQDPKIWDESISAGASVFLPKPFSPPQVKMMLRMLIRKSGF